MPKELEQKLKRQAHKKGMGKKRSDAYARATLFLSRTTDLIDFPFPYAQVPGTVERRGVELEVGTPIAARWRIDGSYTHTEGENPPLTILGLFEQGHASCEIHLRPA